MTRPCYFLPALLISATAFLSAQTAPRPAQLAAAKTVFVSNATSSSGSANPDSYNTFYAEVQTLNRFSVVASPAQADLILELDVVADHFTLRILDPRSTIVLWSMSEAVFPANRTSTAVKNEHTALLNLVGDLKQICVPTP